MTYNITIINKKQSKVVKQAKSVIDLNEQLRTYRRKGILIEDVTANR